MPLAAWERELVGGVLYLCFLLWPYPSACVSRTPQPSTLEWTPRAAQMMTMKMLCKLWKILFLIKHLWLRPQNQCVPQRSGEWPPRDNFHLYWKAKLAQASKRPPQRPHMIEEMGKTLMFAGSFRPRSNCALTSFSKRNQDRIKVLRTLEYRESEA